MPTPTYRTRRRYSKVASLWGVDPEDVTAFPRCLEAYQETREKVKRLLTLTKPSSTTA